MIFLFQNTILEPDLQHTLISAVKEVVKHCMLPPPLFILVSQCCPTEVAVAGLSRLHVLLANSVVGRREFVTTGTIMTLQRMEAAIGPTGTDYIYAINSLFPKDLVAYYRSRI